MAAKKMAGSSSSRANILCGDQSNQNYILAHSVSGEDWQFQRMLPASVYDIYMKYWGNVVLTI
ncbi:MAG: hypothetical protein WB581_04230 [Halobacteriota archaeon]